MSFLDGRNYRIRLKLASSKQARCTTLSLIPNTSSHHHRSHSSPQSSVTVNNINNLHLIVLLIKYTNDNDNTYCGTL